MKKLLHFMLLLFVIGISNAQTPVHRFNFENNLQNTANNLTLTGANITYEAGRNASAGQAMVINNNASSNSYIDTTINGLSTTGGAFSVCFWAKLNTNTRVGYENRYISIGTNTTVSGVNRGFTFWQDRNNNFDRFAVNCGAGSFPAAQFLSSPATTWNFFALVYDGSGTVKLYRNGTLESATTTATNITLGNLILKMGRWNDTVYDVVITSSYSMDDLQLFNVALTDAQVATIYSPAQVPVISAVSSSPVGTTTATINYIINAGGAATTPIIRYGLSSTTLNNSQTGAVVNGATTIAQDVNLTGLTAGTTYFYRVEASNLVGSATPSSTLSFATTVATIVPVISSVSSSSVTVNAATINYSINAGGAATTPVIRYGLTAANLNLNQTGTVANGTTATAMSAGLTGLTSGTTYFYRVEASNSAGSATPSSTLSFTTAGSTVSIPVVTNLQNFSTTTTTANIAFTVNPNGAVSTTSITLTDIGTGTNYFVSGPTAIAGTTNQVLTYIIPDLNPGTCYKYIITATNSAGTSVATIAKAFCTNDLNDVKTPIYHFEFNGNTQDKNDSTLAFGNPNSGFVDNNSAIRLNNNPQAINLPFLPQGSAGRTVAIRVMFESGALSQANNVFGYGTATANNSYGYTQDNTTQATQYIWGSNDVVFSNSTNFGTYYNLVFVFDGLADYKIYRNGGQIAAGSSGSLNTIGTMFRLGRTTTGVGGFFNGRVDDLRIYNQAMTANEVSALNSTLAIEGFTDTLKFNLYPNPASEVLKIDIENELQSFEIYSLQGQKVLSVKEKQINVSTLSSGTYMVKVQDKDGAFGTHKFVKE